MLAINTNSFHYRYYCWVRRMWGFTGDPQTTSLCPYFQTILWGSIFCVLTAPGLVLGWIFMKLGRLGCRLQNPVMDTIIEVLDSKTQWIDRLDKGPTNFSESPAITGLLFTFFGISTLVLLAAAIGVVGSIVGLLGYGAWNIVNIALAVFGFITWVFAKLFMIFYCLGFIFHSIYSGTVWLFTNGPLWYGVGAWTVWALAWILGIGVAALILCVLFIGISKLPFARRFGKFLTNKFNGYGEAQKKRELRKAEAIKLLPPWECGYCKYKDNPAQNARCSECDWSKPTPKPTMPKWLYVFVPLIPIEWLLVMAAELCNKIKSRDIDVLGPLGIVWTYVVAMKRGVCPIVEFVDPAKLQAEAQASAQERMDKEREGGAQKADDADDTSLGAELLDEIDAPTSDEKGEVG